MRFHLHPDGWPVRVELPARAVVPVDHPWAGGADTETVDGLEELLRRTVHGLVATVRPLVEACHRTARVGAAGLWNEVGDSLGRAVAFQQLVAVTPEMLSVLRAAVAVPGTPWRARPRLDFADSAAGPVHVVQKGGCCLAYTVEGRDVPTADDPSLDPDRRAFLQRFPIDPDQPRYCTACSFRTAADTEARQVFLAERRAGVPTSCG